ncbi:MAG TPA: hypothetical protein VH309_00130, partial [Elusimicrobiota bacterium]|nr:hypothetical protein [Elusimicrobiota bacterium]
MRKTALAGLLLASLAAAPARAQTPARESVRRLATALRSDASALRSRGDAPPLVARLNGLIGALKALVGEDVPTAAAEARVEDSAAALAAEVAREPRPWSADFRRAAAPEVSALSARALGLLADAAGGPARGGVPAANSPPPESAALTAFRGRAAAMSAVMGDADFDGNAPAP